MSRRISREMVLQALFQVDFNEEFAEDALEAARDEHEEETADAAMPYAEELFAGVQEHKAEIDEKIGQYSVDWTVERMPAVDRNILRIAVYEIFFAAEPIPAGVAINEAVEIAKLFSTDESSRFVNGILGKMVK